MFLAVRALLKLTPNDKNLQSLVARMNERLEEAHKKESAAEVTNPLQSAIELLCLNEVELNQFLKVFYSLMVVPHHSIKDRLIVVFVPMCTGV